MSDQGSADEEPGDDLWSEAWDGEVWDVDDEEQSEDGGDGGDGEESSEGADVLSHVEVQGVGGGCIAMDLDVGFVSDAIEMGAAGGAVPRDPFRAGGVAEPNGEDALTYGYQGISEARNRHRYVDNEGGQCMSNDGRGIRGFVRSGGFPYRVPPAAPSGNARRRGAGVRADGVATRGVWDGEPSAAQYAQMLEQFACRCPHGSAFGRGDGVIDAWQLTLARLEGNTDWEGHVVLGLPKDGKGSAKMHGFKNSPDLLMVVERFRLASNDGSVNAWEYRCRCCDTSAKFAGRLGVPADDCCIHARVVEHVRPLSALSPKFTELSDSAGAFDSLVLPLNSTPIDLSPAYNGTGLNPDDNTTAKAAEDAAQARRRKAIAGCGTHLVFCDAHSNSDRATSSHVPVVGLVSIKLVQNIHMPICHWHSGLSGSHRNHACCHAHALRCHVATVVTTANRYYKQYVSVAEGVVDDGEKARIEWGCKRYPRKPHVEAQLVALLPSTSKLISSEGITPGKGGAIAKSAEQWVAGTALSAGRTLHSLGYLYVHSGATVYLMHYGFLCDKLGAWMEHGGSVYHVRQHFMKTTEDLWTESEMEHALPCKVFVKGLIAYMRRVRIYDPTLPHNGRWNTCLPGAPVKQVRPVRAHPTT